MTTGRVVTEHDVLEGAWYLDAGRIPTCIAVEAGQADLFLSAYLGIDFETRGLAVYRLLDAVVTFHDELPAVGQVIRYDIAIDEFFRQGDSRLFRFRFEASVDGRPLMTMSQGCAGFFTAEALAAGRGVVKTALDLRDMPRPPARRLVAPGADGRRIARRRPGRGPPPGRPRRRVRPGVRGARPAPTGPPARRPDAAGRPGPADRSDRRAIRARPDPRRGRHPPRRLVHDLPLRRRPRDAGHAHVRVLPAYVADLPGPDGLDRRGRRGRLPAGAGRGQQAQVPGAGGRVDEDGHVRGLPQGAGLSPRALRDRRRPDVRRRQADRRDHRHVVADDGARPGQVGKDLGLSCPPPAPGKREAEETSFTTPRASSLSRSAGRRRPSASPTGSSTRAG